MSRVLSPVLDESGNAHAELSLVDAQREMMLTVRFTGAKELRARLWIAKRLARLTAWVMHWRLKIEVDRA